MPVKQKHLLSIFKWFGARTRDQCAKCCQRRTPHASVHESKHARGDIPKSEGDMCMRWVTPSSSPGGENVACNSKINTPIAGSHLGHCFTDLQARLSACVWVLHRQCSDTNWWQTLCFLMFLKQAVNEVTNDKH